MRIIIILFLGLMMLFPDVGWSMDISCQLSRNELEVGLDPAKETINVLGKAPENAPVIIKVEGPERPVLVSLFQDDSFIKFSEAEVMGLPGFYQTLTSLPMEEIYKKHWSALGLTPEYNDLRSDAWVRMRQEVEDVYQRHYDDYVSMALSAKDKKHLFAVRQGVVNRNKENYWAEIPLITGMPLGEIKVTAMTVVNDQVIFSEPQIINLKPASLLSLGSRDLSISAIMVITLFMVPIILLTIAQIMEIINYRKEQEKRARLLRQIWQ